MQESAEHFARHDSERRWQALFAEGHCGAALPPSRHLTCISSPCTMRRWARLPRCLAVSSALEKRIRQTSQEYLLCVDTE